MKKQIYIFSGLGADERVFQRLDFSGFSVTFIKWIPAFKNENIENYASRLLIQITSRKPIIIGLSFGGMVAVEIAKQILIEKVILIASAKTKKEIPPYFRYAGKIRVHKLLPTRLLKAANFLSYWFFGANSADDKRLLKQILFETDPDFLNWAIDRIIRWENQIKLENVCHIHGRNDRILPYMFVNCGVTVEGGGHLMPYNKAEELNSILRDLLKPASSA